MGAPAKIWWISLVRPCPFPSSLFDWFDKFSIAQVLLVFQKVWMFEYHQQFSLESRKYKNKEVGLIESVGKISLREWSNTLDLPNERDSSIFSDNSSM